MLKCFENPPLQLLIKKKIDLTSKTCFKVFKKQRPNTHFPVKHYSSLNSHAPIDKREVNTSISWVIWLGVVCADTSHSYFCSFPASVGQYLKTGRIANLHHFHQNSIRESEHVILRLISKLTRRASGLCFLLQCFAFTLFNLWQYSMFLF